MLDENCLNMFSSDDKLATFIRSCILCQLLTVNTLLFGLLRQQILLLYQGITQGINSISSDDSNGIQLSLFQNILMSFIMFLPPISLAIWYPHIGTLGALIAAFSTMFVIYILPLATYSKAVYLQEKIQNANGHDDDYELFQPQIHDVNFENNYKQW